MLWHDNIFIYNLQIQDTHLEWLLEKGKELERACEFSMALKYYFAGKMYFAKYLKWQTRQALHAPAFGAPSVGGAQGFVTPAPGQFGAQGASRFARAMMEEFEKMYRDLLPMTNAEVIFCYRCTCLLVFFRMSLVLSHRDFSISA